jgi:hypothetical protein
VLFSSPTEKFGLLSSSLKNPFLLYSRFVSPWEERERERNQSRIALLVPLPFQAERREVNQ